MSHFYISRWANSSSFFTKIWNPFHGLKNHKNCYYLLHRCVLTSRRTSNFHVVQIFLQQTYLALLSHNQIPHSHSYITLYESACSRCLSGPEILFSSSYDCWSVAIAYSRASPFPIWRSIWRADFIQTGFLSSLFTMLSLCSMIILSWREFQQHIFLY